MPDAKPKNINQYKTWLKRAHHVDISMRTANHYDAVAGKALTDFKASPLWQKFISRLKGFNEEYYSKTNYYLLLDNSLPELKTKPFGSFLDKTFRKNVVNNVKWPGPPDDEWILPDNWFEHINDMVRTYLVVKYLDGVNFLASNLEKLCNETECPCKVDYEAKQEGYYAAHVYVSFTCDIPRPDWDTKKEAILFEIQITTQLQEVIRRLLHKYYEGRRAEASKLDMNWQWDYKSEEFAANYLGHILHYVEGMIMDIRDKKLGKGGPE